MTKFKKHWQRVVIGLLCVGLIVLGNNYISLHEKYEESQADYEWARESLEKSTLELVEVRKKLVPRDFEDYEELVGWVQAWEIENKPLFVEFLGLGFAIGGNEEVFGRYKNCVDASEAMVMDALWDGYRMSEALVDGYGGYYGVKVSEHGNHDGCLAVAGNVYYWIEPQTGEIVFIIRRD